MKRIFIVSSATLVLVLGFQNCQKGQMSQVSQSNGGSPSTVVSTDIGPANAGAPAETITSLNQENIQKITLNDLESYNLQRKSSSSEITVNGMASYSISYDKGEITRTLERFNGSQKYCLSAALLAELKDILAMSKVCRYDKRDQNTVCTQEYKVPYAQIETVRDTLDLGSSQRCGVSVDLCDENSMLLKRWWVAVKKKLSQLNCAP